MTDVRQGVYPTPLDDPFADDRTRPFWDAALAGELRAPRCDTCGTFVLPPSAFCFSCQGQSFTWVGLPGTGTIYTFTIVRHPLHPGLADVVPYVSGIVELDGTQGAGARLIVNITDCDLDEVKIGDAVEIYFERVSDTFAQPRARWAPS